MKKENCENRIMKYFAVSLEILLLVMTVTIVVRYVSYLAVTKYGIQNDTIVGFTKGIDVSAITASDEGEANAGILDKIKNKVYRKTKIIESLSTVSFPIADKANKAVYYLNKDVFHNNFIFNSGVYGVAGPATKAAKDIERFINYLSDKNIPHVYVHTPYVEYNKYILGNTEKIERWDTVNGRERFLEVLNEDGVTYIDFLRDMGDYPLTFDSSNHWQSKDALYAARMTVNYLNAVYGMSLDSEKLIPDLYYNVSEENEEFQNTVNELEGFNWQYLVPKEAGYYSIRRDADEDSGPFRDCFVNPVEEWRTSSDVYHNVCGLNNGNPYYITNHNKSDDSKLLIIGDSFAWPVYSYLAQEFNYEAVVWNNTDGFSYYYYIEDWKPDAVVIMLNDCQLSGGYRFDFNY